LVCGSFSFLVYTKISLFLRLKFEGFSTLGWFSLEGNHPILFLSLTVSDFRGHSSVNLPPFHKEGLWQLPLGTILSPPLPLFDDSALLGGFVFFLDIPFVALNSAPFWAGTVFPFFPTERKNLSIFFLFLCEISIEKVSGVFFFPPSFHDGVFSWWWASFSLLSFFSSYRTWPGILPPCAETFCLSLLGNSFLPRREF